MIIVKLQGGLANQMFQYATGRVLSLLNKTELKLDVSFYEKQQGITPRSYALDVYNIQAAIASSKEILSLKGTSNKFIRNLFTRLIPVSYIKEKGFSFQPMILELQGDVYLEGYWQSEKYFEQYRSQIREDFTLKSEYQNNLDNTFCDQMSQEESIAIHVRRGDYVSDKTTNGFHGVCGINYYINAIDYIKRKDYNSHYFIFSDDIDWCKLKFNFLKNVTFVEGNKAYEDLYYMSQCHHQIIANSSFSWWGACLNKNNNKIVVAPKNWFADPSIDTSDLIPDSWIKI